MQSWATPSPAPAGPVSDLRFDQSSSPQSSPTFLAAMQHVTPYFLLITPRPLLLQLDALQTLSAPARHSPGTPYPCQTASIPRLPAPSHHSPGIPYTSFIPQPLHCDRNHQHISCIFQIDRTLRQQKDGGKRVAIQMQWTQNCVCS